MKKHLIFTLACLLVFGYLSTTFTLYSNEKTPAEKWAEAELALGSAMTQMETLNTNLQKKRAEYTEKGNNALQAAVTMFNPIDAIKTLFLGRGTPNRLWQLKQEITSIYIQMESLNGDLGMLASARDTAYEAYKKTTSQPSDKGPEPKYADIPNFSLSCLNGCGTVYQSKSVGLGNLSDKAIMGHGVYCTSDPHKSYWYYSCPPEYPGCPASDDHYLSCVGGCGQTGKPQWGYIGRTSYGYSDKKGLVGNQLVTIASHLKRCGARLSKTNPSRTCPGRYYACNNQTSANCPNASNHVSDSTPPQSTDNTPNCQDCTSDCSSPCSCTNSGTCGGTVTDNTPNCSGCTSHCSSPCSCSDSGTCNGTVAAPPPSPPEPTLVACERGRGCTVRSSNGRQCYVDPSRSACGHGYWSCNASAVSWHVTPHPCTRSGCDASYTNCSRGNGTCRAPHPRGGTYKWHGN